MLNKHSKVMKNLSNKQQAFDNNLSCSRVRWCAYSEQSFYGNFLTFFFCFKFSCCKKKFSSTELQSTACDEKLFFSMCTWKSSKYNNCDVLHLPRVLLFFHFLLYDWRKLNEAVFSMRCYGTTPSKMQWRFLISRSGRRVGAVCRGILHAKFVCALTSCVANWIGLVVFWLSNYFSSKLRFLAVFDKRACD